MGPTLRVASPPNPRPSARSGAARRALAVLRVRVKPKVSTMIQPIAPGTRRGCSWVWLLTASLVAASPLAHAQDSPKSKGAAATPKSKGSAPEAKAKAKSDADAIKKKEETEPEPEADAKPQGEAKPSTVE